MRFRLGGARIGEDLPRLLERHRLSGPQRLVGPVQLQLEQRRLPAAAGGAIDLDARLFRMQARLAEARGPLQEKLAATEVRDARLDGPKVGVGRTRNSARSRLDTRR